MSNTQQTETVALKACRSCGGGLLERDRFCRWCGARQEVAVAIAVGAAMLAAELQVKSSRFTTTALDRAAPDSAAEQVNRYRPVSGPLVKAVVESLSANSSARPQGGPTKRTMLALISLPIWMIIVLLSPFDAYAAAKSISKGI